MTKRLFTFALLVLLVIAPASVVAGKLSKPEIAAVLERVDITGRSITLGGQTYRLAKDVRWVGLKGRAVHSVVPLLAGHRVGYKLDYVGNDVVVTEVWIRK